MELTYDNWTQYTYHKLARLLTVKCKVLAISPIGVHIPGNMTLLYYNKLAKFTSL